MSSSATLARTVLVTLGIVASLLLGSGLPAVREIVAAEPPARLAVTHGVASGDVSATSAVIWARASGPARMQVEYDTDRELGRVETGPPGEAVEARDFTARVKLTGLASDTTYYYRVSLVGADGGRSEGVAGTFKTAPDRAAARPISFVVGGDVAGQGYCRRPGVDYTIFAPMLALGPDFFIANGDLVYTDGDCPAEGPEGWQNIPGDFANIVDPGLDWTDLPMVRENFRRHWRYNRADPQLQRFLQGTSMYSQWDDHEVINDFGGPWDHWNAATRERPGYPTLVTAGRDALFEYSPIDRHPSEPDRIYRSFNWGRDLDLFILDARSYRSRNDLPDTPEQTIEWKIPEWSNAIERDRARVYFTAYAAAMAMHFIEKALVEVRAGQTKVFENFDVPDEAIGCGFHEAVRGVLSHHLVIKDKKIANYHPYPPTPWNGSPTDSYGTPGPYEDAVTGQPIFEENGPDDFRGVDIMRAVRSFDPCLPCGVHMYLGGGKTLKRTHSPMFGAQGG